MDIYDQLKRDEGLRLKPYLDSVGIKTIGYGHNLIAKPLPDVDNGITVERANQILIDDVHDMRIKLVQDIPWVLSLDDARYGVLQNMAFNLGVPGLLKFHNTLAYVQARDFGQAALNMEHSAWYNQVGARARRLVQQMRTGVWQ